MFINMEDYILKIFFFSFEKLFLREIGFGFYCFLKFSFNKINLRYLDIFGVFYFF